jgi:HlyD family secretion protein
VKVLNPDDYLRPEMNSSVAFVSEEKVAVVGAQARPVIMIPVAAIHDNAVFVMFDGKAVRRAVKTGSTNSKGIRIEDGLIGGEDLILNPPATLKDGDRVKAKQS